MKIRVLSDLHLEFQAWTPPASPADLVVLAGDIDTGVEGMNWGREYFHRGDLLNPCFASDLSALLRPPVKLWIHGHTHESMDYDIEGTRVVCNPRGYLPEEPNKRFNPRLVVEVAD
jgi:Icc-related predicted phosphoesterase